LTFCRCLQRSWLRVTLCLVSTSQHSSLVRNGRAHHALKPHSKKREQREETKEEKAEKSKQEQRKRVYQELDKDLQTRGIDLAEVPKILREHQEMSKSLKAHSKSDEAKHPKP
jgi:hypothetical protein